MLQPACLLGPWTLSTPRRPLGSPPLGGPATRRSDAYRDGTPTRWRSAARRSTSPLRGWSDFLHGAPWSEAIGGLRGCASVGGAHRAQRTRWTRRCSHLQIGCAEYGTSRLGIAVRTRTHARSPSLVTPLWSMQIAQLCAPNGSRPRARDVRVVLASPPPQIGVAAWVWRNEALVPRFDRRHVPVVAEDGADHCVGPLVVFRLPPLGSTDRASRRRCRQSPQAPWIRSPSRRPEGRSPIVREGCGREPLTQVASLERCVETDGLPPEAR